MTELTPLHYIMIALGALALLFLILWLVAQTRAKREQNRLAEQRADEKQKLSAELQDKAEKERLEQDKAFAQQKQSYDETVSKQALQIDSLKHLSKDGGEYLTDMTLIQLKERLVRNERIRPEDMHVLANIFIPGRDLKRTEKIAHIVLTRTGIYILDSHYWKGHIYHGVDQTQFSAEPMFEHVFSLLDIDPYIEQTLAMERDDEKNTVYFRSLRDNIEDLKRRAELVEETFQLKYPVTSIAYFNREGHDAGTMNNYSRDKKVKVVIGEEELELFFEKYVFHGRFQYSVDELEEIRDRIEHLNP
ncbi:nuclease-related domain-containing protein [Macrococcus equipercicus]|uniref:NERD domain-containing protein n=1 Tax=Macrococcus equipercicus TaxID=69967 RepID=A0A9Q9BPE9_9STAP|nr:NERD domain-containing protein [Macrococcus equipercicus]UTH13261.1 NERD domain-containing protein [Macrococcus equipercicus]